MCFFLGVQKSFFGTQRTKGLFLGYQSLFLGYKKFVLDFSEVKEVSSIVKFFFTFWKVKKRQGWVFQRSVIKKQPQKQQQKQQQKTEKTASKAAETAKAATKRPEGGEPKGPEGRDPEGLFVLSLASSRGISVVFSGLFLGYREIF